MLVTITTDASYYHDHKIGGYAFWITSNMGRLRYSNAFSVTINSPHDAEFKCIINALHFLKKTGWEVTRLVINTDSQTTIDHIEKIPPIKVRKTKKLPQHAIDNINYYKAIISHLKSPVVSLRHVKGHTHTNTTRNWVNQWCDDNAKAAAKKKIKFG